ncbi:helix-turn-helix transcriptional regulator [Sporosarcina sp. FSL K6-3457]|uniref:helix-turn-helix transcriptional regulator n=1 Tax=Sporosarcina sp. FSL K6-3457 TaxID=2978204 RepID=UPI0030F61D8A
MHRHVDLGLKAARVEKGFTQEALAEKLGVSKKTLASWENGEVELKPLALYAIAYVFQMDADYLRVPDKR